MFSLMTKMSLLTAECTEVIGLRMLRAAVGVPAAMKEARLMVSEKSEAALRYGPPLMAGGSLEQMVNDYRGII